VIDFLPAFILVLQHYKTMDAHLTQGQNLLTIGKYAILRRRVFTLKSHIPITSGITSPKGNITTKRTLSENSSYNR